MTPLEIPQWQGSSSPDARLLIDGAARLAAHLPGPHRVPTADGAGQEVEGVRALDVLHGNLTAARLALAGEDAPSIVLGGDCGIEVAPIERAARRCGDALTVVWFDAHADMNSPESSPSGAFHGMVLRTLLGEGPAALAPTHPLRPEQVVLAGTRAFDPPERDFIAENGIRHVPAADLETLPETVRSSVLYIHIDLDVLDPTTFSSLGFPEPDGVTPEALLATVQGLAARATVAGLGITEYQPGSAADEETLATLVPALISAVQ